MPIGEQQIKIAAKLYEARDVMKRLHGDNYPALVKQFQGFITSEMKNKNCGELTASKNIVSDLQRDCPDSGMSQALIFAACVELIEPSTPIP